MQFLHMCLESRSAASSELLNHAKHRLMDLAVRREHIAAARKERRAVQPGDPAAGFLDDQRAAGDVPGLEIAFPEAVHAPGRDLAEVDRRRAEAAHRARVADERGEESDDFVDARVDVVRKAGDEHRVDQLRRRATRASACR